MMVNVSLRTLNVDQWMTIASAISNAKPEPVAPGARPRPAWPSTWCRT
ncbi:hypothetical protein LP420_10485 [Massilia sp. B-10]|nr:hypothetical protein LP420_10485 [Massilia sp. B-10]